MLENLPVLVLNKIVLLPYQELRLELDIELSKNIIDNAINNYDHKLLHLYILLQYHNFLD